MIDDNLSVMQTPKTALVGGVNGEHCPCVLTSGSRTRSIASVRVESLRASGLHAAARIASSGSAGKDMTYDTDATVELTPCVVSTSEKPCDGLHGMGKQCNLRALDAGQATDRSPCISNSTASSQSTASIWVASLHSLGLHAANVSMEKGTMVQYDSHATMEVTREIVEGLPPYTCRALKKLKSGENPINIISPSIELLTSDLKKHNCQPSFVVHPNNQQHAGISPLNQAKEEDHAFGADEKCGSTGQFRQPVGQKVRKLFIDFKDTSTASGSRTTGPAIDREVQACDMLSRVLQAGGSGLHDAQKENSNATPPLGREKVQGLNEQRSLPSTIFMASPTNLSCTESQEPGEDSQLNAFAVVDKLVWLNASVAWQEPESKMVADQPSVKGSQGVKGLQSLAHTTEIKNMQGKMGAYDWIDSQPDEDDLSLDSKEVSAPGRAQRKQLEACKLTKNRKRQQQGISSGLDTVNDSNNTSVKAKEASTHDRAVEPHTLSARLRTDKEKPTEEISKFFEHQPFISMQNSPVSDNGIEELHGADASSPKGEMDIIIPSDIGVNTQIALEAIDIMRYDIVTNDESSHKGERELLLPFDIGSNTQSALEAIDIMRHDVVMDAVFIEREGREQNQIDLRLQQPGRNAKKCVSQKGSALNTSEKDVSGKTGGDLLVKSKASPALITIGRRGLCFGVPINRKPLGKRDTSGGFSTSLETHRSQKAQKPLPKPRGLGVNNRKRSPLDFLSVAIPRRKRSRLCAPLGSLNRNMVVTQRQEMESDLHKCHQNADEQTRQNKAGSPEFRKSTWPQKRGDNDTRLAVLTKSTKGNLSRQTKKTASLEALTKLDCYPLFEERRRRKREPGCIRVLFSHSLPEDTTKHQKKILAKLGGHLATSAADSTHFVANSFVRTQNMMESMAAGKAVITTLWLEGCGQAHYFVDEKSYILHDAKKEKELGFCMHSSLATARRKPLLKGMKLLVSPNTFPDFEAMAAIIKTAGGQVVQKVLSSSQLDASKNEFVSIVVASEKDYEFCLDFLERGFRVYSTELILHGIVLQNLDFSRNRLFEEYIHIDKVQSSH